MMETLNMGLEAAIVEAEAPGLDAYVGPKMIEKAKFLAKEVTEMITQITSLHQHKAAVPGKVAEVFKEMRELRERVTSLQSKLQGQIEEAK